MTSPADVLQMVKDNDVKFIDYRLTDTRGKEQHLSVPAHQLTEDTFEDGQPFDGSSMAGWKGIEASDMILLPDPETAHMDPFREQNTLVLTCDVLEPDTGKGYSRDPRSIARRAENYLKSTGIGDQAFFGPEPEFFIFDGVTYANDPNYTFFKIFSEEGPWSSRIEYEGGNLGHRAEFKGGYFPVPPVDTLTEIRAEMVTLLEQQGVPTHYVEQLNDRETVVKKVSIVPLEVIVRNISAGSFAKRYGVEEGIVFDEPTFEFSYKNDDLGDPLMNDYHAIALKLATREEIELIKSMTFKVNDVMKQYFDTLNVTLVDFKLEFGKTADGQIVLADEISPDTCRLWDKTTGEKLDKDRFRRDMGGVEEAYQEIMKRVMSK